MKERLMRFILAMAILSNVLIVSTNVVYADNGIVFSESSGTETVDDDKEKLMDDDESKVDTTENEHVHELNYFLQNNDIVEKCDCGHTAQANVVFSDDVTSIITDGAPKEPAVHVEFSENWQGSQEQPTVTYTNNVLSGRACATVVIEGISVDLAFEIMEAPEKINDVGVKSSVVWDYDENLKKLTISGVGEMDAIPMQGDSKREEVVSVEVQDGITSIKASAFADMINLKDVSLPDSLTKVEPRAFMGCIALEEIFLPDSIVSMGDRIFNGCTSLRKVNFPKSWAETPYTYYGIIYNYIRGEIFSDCPSLTEITVPEGVTEIPSAAFSKASFRHVYLPSTLQRIDSDAFIGSAIEEIVIPKTVTYAAGFSGCQNLRRVEYQSDDTFGGCTEIEFNCFEDCINLQEVIFPQALEIIRDSAFADCRLLDDVVFPENVTSIQEYAFSNCTSLKSIALPEKMKAIGYRAFSGCSGLEEITIPAAFEQFRDKNTMPGDEGGAPLTFAGCTSLKNYHVSEDNKRFSDINGILCNKSGTSIVHWPAGRTTVEFPQTVTDLGYKAFAEYQQKEIVIPSQIKTIGRYAFANSKVEIVTFEAGNLDISEYGFTNTSLRTLQWPDDMRSLDLSRGAFSGCEKLESVVLPECITSLKNATSCFSSCTALKNINIPLGISEIPKSFLRNCSSLETLTIPANITSIDSEAFSGSDGKYAGLKTIFFEGNAPAGLNSASLPKDVQIYYPGLATGWTSPTWNGYSAEPNPKFGVIDVTPNVSDEYVLPNIDLTQTITLRFNKKIGDYKGNIYIYKYDTDELVEKISLLNAQKRDEYTLEFILPYVFDSATKYYILIDDDFAVSADGPVEHAEGIYNKDVWYFRAADSSTFTDAITEEDLFLKYPQFLTDNIRLAGLNQVFSEILRNNVSAGDQLGASISWVLQNLTPNYIEMGANIIRLEEDSINDALGDVFYEGTSIQQLAEYNKQIKAAKKVFEGITIILEDLEKHYPGELDPAADKRNYEGAKFNDLAIALYRIDPTAFRTAFPEYNYEGGIAAYLEETDFSDEFDKAFDEKIASVGVSISTVDWAISKLCVWMDYVYARSISLELMDEFIEQSAKLGYDDQLYRDLIKLRQKLAEESLSSAYVSDYINTQSILSKGTSFYLDFLSDIEPSGAFTIKAITFAGDLVGKMMEKIVPSASEILKLYNYAGMAGRSRTLLEAQIKWFQEYKMTSEDIETFRSIYNIYVSSLIQLGKGLQKLNLSAEDQQTLSMFVSFMEEEKGNLYTLFLQDCLCVARPYLESLSTKLQYQVRDGKAYITGFSNAAARAALFKAQAEPLHSIADKKAWLTIPSEIDGYPVAGIESNAFSNDNDLQMIFVQPDIEYVGESAFSGCQNLKTVLFMGSVGTIQNRAFYDTGLQTITLPENMQHIETNAFSSCENLKAVIVNDSNVEIDQDAFDAREDVAFAGRKDSTISQYAQQNGLNFSQRKGEVVAVQIKDLPYSRECTVGSQPDMSGMVLEVSFADGSKEEVWQGWHSLYDTSKLGETQVMVYYGDVKVQYSVTVLAEQSVGNVQEGKDPSPSVGANTDNNSGATSSLLNETELAVRDDVNAGQDITSQVHTHDFGTEWHWDAEYHWLECPCGAKSNRALHQYKEVDDSQEECAICGYKCGESSEITKDVEEVKDEHNEKNIYSILLIAIFSVGCLIAIGFVVLRKKRETT